MHLKIYFFFLFILSFLPLSAGEIDPWELDFKIHKLNDSGKYDQSIIFLEKILSDPTSTPYDRYNAYLQKSFTYKRVFNYTEAANNLNLAAREGEESKHHEEARVRIAAEKLFILFDLQKDKEVAKILAEMRSMDLSLLDAETRGHYLSLLAALDIDHGKFKEAASKLNQCILIFSSVNPRHLPNIYTKKIKLAEKMHGPESEVLTDYKKGLQSAEKYGVDLYRRNMHLSLYNYYTEMRRPEKAAQYKKLAEEVRFDDDFAMNDQSLKLIDLERKLQHKRLLQEQEKQKNFQYVLAFLIFSAGLLIFVFYRLHHQNIKKRVKAEEENNQIRAKLEKTLSINESSRPTGNDRDLKNIQETNTLSGRQLEIIELVRQGKTNREIGTILFISENTVKYHLKIIYNELGIENRYELK